MTPAEFERVQWAHIERQKEHGKDIIAIGWWSAYFHRQQRLPSLKTVTTPARTLTGKELEARQTEFTDLEREMGG